MGNTSEVKELLEGGADVNERNNVSAKFSIQGRIQDLWNGGAQMKECARSARKFLDHAPF